MGAHAARAHAESVAEGQVRAYQFLLVCRVTAFGGPALCLFEFARGIGRGALRFCHLRAVAREHGAAFRGGEESADGRKILVSQGGIVAHGHGVFEKAYVGLRTALARARHVGNNFSVFEFDDAVGVLLGKFAVVRNHDDAKNPNASPILYHGYRRKAMFCAALGGGVRPHLGKDRCRCGNTESVAVFFGGG